jgi:hypothetical protein
VVFVRSWTSMGGSWVIAVVGRQRTVLVAMRDMGSRVVSGSGRVHSVVLCVGGLRIARGGLWPIVRRTAPIHHCAIHSGPPLCL